MSTPSSSPLPQTLQFGQAVEQDTEKLCVFARTTFTEAFSEQNTLENLTQYVNNAFTSERIHEEILDPNNVFVLVEHEQTLIAYYKLKTGVDSTDSTLPALLREKPSIELERFYVDFNWHGSGVARQMMQHCLDLAKSLHKEYLWLGVWEQNIRAQKFYKKWDFEVVGSHPFVMGDEIQTDYWMLRSLNGITI